MHFASACKHVAFLHRLGMWSCSCDDNVIIHEEWLQSLQEVCKTAVKLACSCLLNGKMKGHFLVLWSHARCVTCTCISCLSYCSGMGLKISMLSFYRVMHVYTMYFFGNLGMDGFAVCRTIGPFPMPPHIWYSTLLWLLPHH